ncbi:hypothetical protein AN639_10425 [Candidatus Epulonipiscium fishelsonii]|uniref:Uncharacterized protein n=1 Tax=Candidatus Epulonipiscium fishelsonii TaxID=77094 RepID=A0ACC8XAJ1_9FIRM|nr:hypothetical protein AN396_09045 [Epulopiscium sp. SCG-B11WGA-EpuloA1]ONI43509.1 hypothetical protein AN639_10425 [Epulopiscium sp. SCG-B05WGA-EpuloA1]
MRKAKGLSHYIYPKRGVIIYMEILKLVSPSYPISNTYRPINLVQDPITKVWLVKEAFEQFYKMNNVLQKEGLSSLCISSGYRSYMYQQSLCAKKEKLGFNNIAKEGCSEHQLGIAMDLMTTPVINDTRNNDLSVTNLNNRSLQVFDLTFHKQWLDINSADFGFILRYPFDKSYITGVPYKAYHYRYVGVSHAKKIVKNGLCLEEYIEMHTSMRYF